MSNTNGKTQPLSLKRLLEELETHRDVHTRILGTVRLKLLEMPAKMRILEAQAALERNEAGEFTNEAELMDWGSLLLSVSIVDEHDVHTFDNQQGREAILLFPMHDFDAALDGAIALNGLDSATQQKKTA